MDLNTPKWIVNEMYIVKFISPEHETLRRVISECSYTVDENGITNSAIDISTLFSQRACLDGLPYRVNTNYEFFKLKIQANKTH